MQESTNKSLFLKKQAGFIGTIALVVVTLITIKYFFDFDIVKYLTSDKAGGVFEYIKRFFEIVWTKYIAGTFWYLWNNIVVDVFWKGIVSAYTILTGWVDKN